jgi:uncharacterized protein YecT (DUF1311 family)
MLVFRALNKKEKTVKIRRIFWVRIGAIALFLTAVLSVPSIASNSPWQLVQTPNCKTTRSTLEKTWCANQEFQAAEKNLDRVYQKLEAGLNSRQHDRLTAAQNSWIKFRQDSCNYEAGRFEGGTLAPSVSTYCKARLTQERVKDLERYLKEEGIAFIQ